MATTGSSNQNRERVYDPLRQLWVSATEEEIVRQRLLSKMVGSLCYPKELLVIERALGDLCKDPTLLKTPKRRIDIVCFARKGKEQLLPLLVIECKESRKLAKSALSQVLGYNFFLGAPFVAISDPEGETCVYRQGGIEYRLPYLPSYSTLIQAVGYGN